MRHAVKFADESTGLIEGIAIPFGGPFKNRAGNSGDLYGEFFTQKTEFCFDWFPTGRPLLYEHGFDGELKTAVVGRQLVHEIRDAGVWMQAQLDKSSEYFDAIAKLIKEGKLYLSSGSVGHLARSNTKTGEITSWPWIEESLTPNPANVYATVEETDAVAHFKSASLDVPSLADLAAKALPEGATPIHADHGHGPPAGSYEALMAALRKAACESVEKETESYCEGWVSATYSDYFVFSMYADKGYRFYRVAYSVGDDGKPVLGEWQEVMEAYVPLKMPDLIEAPMAMAWARFADIASALAARAEALATRRADQGRRLSDASCQSIAEASAAVDRSLAAVRALAAPPAPAESSDSADDQAVRLKLKAATSAYELLGLLDPV